MDSEKKKEFKLGPVSTVILCLVCSFSVLSAVLTLIFEDNPLSGSIGNHPLGVIGDLTKGLGFWLLFCIVAIPVVYVMGYIFVKVVRLILPQAFKNKSLNQTKMTE